MRKIKGLQILVFCIALFTAVALAILTNLLLLGRIPLGDFRGVVMTASCTLFVYIFAIIVYRCGLRLMPLPAGEYENDSIDEFVYHVYLLFFLLLFYPVMRSGLIPVPIMRVFYLGLGARLGDNTYSSGIIFDPIFVELGANCIVGQSALIIPHVIEGDRLAMYPVRMGNNVTIGANAIVMADVVIGDNVIVAAGAIVGKGTRIGSGEFWGGVPARRLK